MTIYLIVALLVASVVLYPVGRRLAPGAILKMLVGGLLAMDGIVALAALATAALIWLGAPTAAGAALPHRGLRYAHNSGVLRACTMIQRA